MAPSSRAPIPSGGFSLALIPPWLDEKKVHEVDRSRPARRHQGPSNGPRDPLAGTLLDVRTEGPLPLDRPGAHSHTHSHSRSPKVRRMCSWSGVWGSSSRAWRGGFITRLGHPPPLYSKLRYPHLTCTKRTPPRTNTLNPKPPPTCRVRRTSRQPRHGTCYERRGARGCRHKAPGDAGAASCSARTLARARRAAS